MKKLTRKERIMKGINDYWEYHDKSIREQGLDKCWLCDRDVSLAQNQLVPKFIKQLVIFMAEEERKLNESELIELHKHDPPVDTTKEVKKAVPKKEEEPKKFYKSK